MAVEGVDALHEKLKACPAEKTAQKGFQNIAEVVGDYMSKIQAGSTGSPGIIKFNSYLFGMLCATLPPDKTGDEFPAKMAENWLKAMKASSLVPGTVSSPAWVTSGVDVQTSTSVSAASVPTLSSAVSKLESGLKKVKEDKSPPKAIAQAFHDACMALSFMCIGLGPPSPPPPVPLLFPAK